MEKNIMQSQLIYFFKFLFYSKVQPLNSFEKHKSLKTIQNRNVFHIFFVTRIKCINLTINLGMQRSLILQPADLKTIYQLYKDILDPYEINVYYNLAVFVSYFFIRCTRHIQLLYTRKITSR